MAKKKRKRKLTKKAKILLIILFLPVSVTVFTLTAILWTSIKNPGFIHKSASALLDMQEMKSETAIPEQYISIYIEAADSYGIPWTLLAAHHRIETKFSTMDPLLSPAGAEGHMQFMPCTFVGWQHPSCSDLGKGDIPEDEKTDPKVIKEYGGYGIDANGDGIADPYDVEDAMHSAAKYLADSGAADGEYEKAIFDYNRSDKYVKDVLWFFNMFEAARLEAEAEK